LRSPGRESGQGVEAQGLSPARFCLGDPAAGRGDGDDDDRENKVHRQVRRAWAVEQVRAFLAVAAEDRLHAAWRMSLYGLRRGEVLGLRWDAVDWGSFAEQCPAHREKWCAPCYRFEGGYRPATVRIDTARVLVDYRVIVKDPKVNGRGIAHLPLDAEVVAALRAP
jgi:integrase